MNIIESLKTDIEASKDWKGTDRSVLNQITIMEALVFLIGKAIRCETCGGTGTMLMVTGNAFPFGDSNASKSIPCNACSGTGKST